MTEYILYTAIVLMLVSILFFGIGFFHGYFRKNLSQSLKFTGYGLIGLAIAGMLIRFIFDNLNSASSSDDLKLTVVVLFALATLSLHISRKVEVDGSSTWLDPSRDN